jgi:16S rRNA (guanine966-N2)-methyltransferase
MRIIAGQWRTRPLEAPPGPGTRPTADRARETLFSMLVSRLGSFEGLAVLDLFAGSGALALEALSRGASRAYLVERDRAAREAITVNIAKFAAAAELVGNDATALPSARQPCDLIFLDPPYGEALAAPALASALARGWVAPSAWISVETDLKETVEAPGFTLETSRKVGKAMLHLLRAA